MKFGKVIIVIIGAVIVTALGIDAADTLTGKSGTMLGQLVSPDTIVGTCPDGMVEMSAPTTFTCVDRYEASPAESCGSGDVTVAADTQALLGNQACAATSQPETTPWTYITRDEAMTACARAGKRLPSAEEWFQFAIDTPGDGTSCNIAGGRMSPTGAREACVSAAGAHDAVGNVWEWTTSDVFDRSFNGRLLPEEGYVTAADQFGIATISSATSSSEAFGEDYIFTEASGAFGLMRGGFYGSREDAGVYAVQASVPTTFAGVAVGFRCVK